MFTILLVFHDPSLTLYCYLDTVGVDGTMPLELSYRGSKGTSVVGVSFWLW